VSRGIYLLANDRFLDHAIAMASSVRAFDPETPLVMLPHCEPAGRAARTLARIPHFALWEDRAALRRLDRRLRLLFGRGFFPRPENLRKLACWHGPFEEFLFVDADLVVFERVAAMLDALREVDFLCYSDQHRSGLAHVFTPRAVEKGLVPATAAREVFNGGFWGSRRGALSEARLASLLEEAARERDCLDRSRGGSDQPILNWVVLRGIARRRNLFREGEEPGMWAGEPHFRPCRGDGPPRLVDPAVGRPLRFLHWAGMRIGPGAPYWKTWLHYRLRDPSLPARLRLDLPPSRRRHRLPRRAERAVDRVLAALDRRPRKEGEG
jgi:hypothetical protein